MHDPSQDFGDVFFAICKAVDTPYALTAWLHWKYKLYSSMEPPRPQAYCDAETFQNDYLCYSWPSKAAVNLEGKDLKAIALEGFIADEEFNRKTTARIKAWSSGDTQPRVEALIHKVRRKIASVLGPLCLKDVLDSCRFGNGASATLSRREARFDKKITTVPLSVSPRALLWGKLVIEADPHFLSAVLDCEVAGPVSLLPCNFEVVDHAVFDTVPKSLKTDRTIAKEPTLNGFLQQGVHVFLRERLKRIGVDLRDQRVNQSWAELAEFLGLATLDLKSASNSVTTALIELLLPQDWYDFLFDLRSHWTLMPDGTKHRNCMFSSMGNAFTFDLESLIFWATLTASCGSHDITSVYGDDLICPQSRTDEVIWALEAFGFRLNRDKSFVSGRFFESCGKHFFGGYEVTPAYQKENPLSSDDARFRAHNRLIRWSLRSGLGVCLSIAVKNACLSIRRGSGYPQLLGPIGPERDDYFQVPYGDYVVRHGHAFIRVLATLQSRVRTKQSGSYAYWLRLKNRSTEPRDGRALRGDVRHRLDALFSEPLVLSEFVEPGTKQVVRKVRIPISGITVDANWYA